MTYFADASRDAMTELGLKGFWMGYFAARSAPLGHAPAAVVTAAFSNFSPAFVARSLPDAWRVTEPSAVIAQRASAAAIALRQIVPDADEYARRAGPMLDAAAHAARCEGRALAAANQALDPLVDPVERLWQATTTLREHRGDGHVAALVANGVGGIESLVLATLTSPDAPDATRLREARGWSGDEWDAAVDRMRAQGLVTDDETGSIAATDAAHLLTARIESTTDDAAWQPYRDGLTDTGLDLLITVLRPLGAALS